MSPDTPATPSQPGRALVIVGAPVGHHPSTGGEMRRQHIIAAVRRIVSVDVFVVHASSGEELAEMASAFDVRTGGLSSNPPKPPRARRTLTMILHPLVPSRICRKDSQRIAAEFAHFRRRPDPYEITIVERIEDYLLLKSELAGHVVVDLDDLESDLLGQARRLRRSSDDPAVGPHPIKAFLRRPFTTIKQMSRRPRLALTLALDERRWKQIERSTAASVGNVLVCNDEDRAKLGSPTNAVMARNGFEQTHPPVGRLDVSDPPTVGFWGSIGYQPNADAAAFLVEDVLPLLQAMIPDVRVLIVGRGADSLDFGERPAVTVEGYVEEMSSALARIDVAVVPLRMGVGTRIKALEAWANRIPVVSTSIGAYGLVQDEASGLLIADGPAELAEALRDALTDKDLRRRLIEEGWTRVQSHSWAAMEAALGKLVSGEYSLPEGHP